MFSINTWLPFVSIAAAESWQVEGTPSRRQDLQLRSLFTAATNCTRRQQQQRALWASLNPVSGIRGGADNPASRLAQALGIEPQKLRKVTVNKDGFTRVTFTSDFKNTDNQQITNTLEQYAFEAEWRMGRGPEIHISREKSDIFWRIIDCECDR